MLQRTQLASSVLGTLLFACSADRAPAAVIPDHTASTQLDACAAASLGRADTLDDLIDQLAVLPGRSVACLVAALPRPFGLVASSSTLSAQPAAGAHDPRIFVMLPGLVMTMVPRGPGASQVELGQWVTPTRTLKGELRMSDSTPLDEQSAFAHIVFGDNQTVCGQCHRDEVRSDEGVARFVSDALRPAPSTLLELGVLVEEHAECARSEEQSERCELYHALFDFGDVSAARFSLALKQMGSL